MLLFYFNLNFVNSSSENPGTIKITSGNFYKIRIGAFTKPKKLYLHNTNLIYALGKNNAEKSALRETFFAKLAQECSRDSFSRKRDFLIDGNMPLKWAKKEKTANKFREFKILLLFGTIWKWEP